MADATNAVPKLTRKLARTLSRVIVSIMSEKLICAVITTRDASGIITITLNMATVTPMDSPNIGITLTDPELP